MIIKLLRKLNISLTCLILISILNIANAQEDNLSDITTPNNANQNQYNLEEIKQTIKEASIDAKKNEEEAKRSLNEANKIVNKSHSTQLVEIAKARVILEKSRKDIAKLQLILAEDLRKTNENLDKISLALKEIELISSQKNLSFDNLTKAFEESTFHWRILADNTLRVFSQENIHLSIEVNNPNDLLHDFINIDDPDLIDEYNNSYKLLKKEYANILILKTDLNNSNKNYQSDLLLKSGKLRASLLQRILSIDKNFIKYNNEYIADLLREIKLIPYRPLALFYSKILKYKQTINSGFVGFVDILRQLGLLAILFVIVLISKTTISKITDSFNSLSQFCAKQSISNNQYTKLAILLSTISPYFKWLILLLIFFLISTIIENTLIAELNILIPYFQYYFMYKIFRIFAYYNLNNFIYRNFEESINKTSLNNKIRKLTKSLGIYLLSCVYLLYLTQTIVRKAHFYNLTLDLFITGLVIISALIAADWKDEVKIISKNKFSKKLNKIIQTLLVNKNRSLFFALPIWFLLITKIIILKIGSLLKNYDFFKNLLSQIYRKKLESAAKKAGLNNNISINDSYLQSFSKINPDKEFILVKDHPYEKINNIINSWKSDKSAENSIVIHGEKGVGKSELIRKITLENNHVNILHTKFDKKITSKISLLEIVTKIFNENLSEKELFKFLSNYDKKTIIILDDCHNLFLAQEGGFEALKIFLNFLVKIDNPNLLWISTFDSFSWNYLQYSLKISTYFRHIIRLNRWSDENIKELIINKHNKTGLKLRYDPLIFALNANRSEQEFEDLHIKFFQIIWSQSKGNPTTAISLWLSSLTQESSRSIKISLPKINKSTHLNSLSDEHFFVYAAIIKHENLSAKEISDILSITKEEVLNIIRIGLEKEYLLEHQDSARYTISSKWKITITQLLINRNFIYAE